MTGRPTKLTDELIEQAKWYLENWQETGDVVPQAVGLCAHIGIVSSTYYKWVAEDTDPRFSEIAKALLDAQHRNLANGGLSGNMNANITKLMLAKHGHSDKVDQTVEHSGSVNQTTYSPDEYKKAQDAMNGKGLD